MTALRRLPLTAAGWTVLGLAVIAYALGAVLGYRPLVEVGAGLAVLVVIGSLWIVVQSQVELSRTVDPDRVSVGEAVLGRIDVRNRSRLPSVPFVAVDWIGTQRVTLPVGPLSAGGRRPVYYSIPTTHRGRVDLGPLTVERRDPLGLLRRARPVAAPAVLWVHPRVHRAATLPVGIVLDYEARTTANARIGTLTFSSLRDYVPGDDPRRIHWRTTARAGHLIVKEHIDTTEPTTTVVLDNVAITDDDTFEQAVEIAASVFRAVELVGRPIRLDAVLPQPVDDALGPLDVLAALERRPAVDFGLLDRLERLQPGGVLVVLTTDDAALLPRLAEQRRRFKPVVVFQLGPRTADSMHRRPGMAVIAGSSAVDAVNRWNHLSGGS